jgi:hypothetical protein
MSTFQKSIFLPLRRASWSCLALTALAASIAHAAPQLPDFTYQGQLTQSGAPANGNFNLTFALFDDAVAGSQVGSTITENAYPVAAGLFTTALAFPGAFTGTQLWLEVTVNGVPMLPRQAISTAPVAQYSLTGSVSNGGVAGGDLSGNYPNPTIASGAVTNSKLAPASVSNSKIVDASISSSKIASGAVTSSAIASGAVGTAELASGAVTRSKLYNGYSNGSIAAGVSAGDCNDYEIGVPNAEVDDFPLFSFASTATSIPPKLVFQALKVTTAGQVTLRICNIGTTSASLPSSAIRVITIK